MFSSVQRISLVIGSWNSSLCIAAAFHALRNDADLDQTEREAVKSTLLRYCELDTLAMVMIFQAWQGFLNEKP